MAHFTRALGQVLCLGFLWAFAPYAVAQSTAVPQLIDQLRQTEPSARVQAAARLAELGPLGHSAPEAIEPLTACLRDANSDVRVYAAYAISRIGADPDRSIRALLPSLQDNDEHVRYSAEWSIAEIAKSVPSQSWSTEDIDRLLIVFGIAKSQLAAPQFQERHRQWVELAIAALQQYQHSSSEKAPSIEPTSTVAQPAPVVDNSADKIDLALRLYIAADMTSKLVLIEKIQSEPGDHFALQLAILKHELESEDGRFADFALQYWLDAKAKLLPVLFQEISLGSSSESLATHVLERFTPDSLAQSSLALKIATDPSQSFGVRSAALVALARSPYMRSELIELLCRLATSRSIDPQLRLTAIQTLSNCPPDENTIASLVALVSQWHGTPESIEAARTLAKIAPQSLEAAQAIAQELNRTPVQHSAFTELADIVASVGPNAASAIDRLIEGLSASDSYIRIVSADALGKMGSAASRATPFLVSRILDPAEEIFVKNRSALALKSIQGNADELLLAQLPNAQVPVREHILRALSVLASGHQDILQRSTEILANDKEPLPVRVAAALAIGANAPVAQAPSQTHAIDALKRSCRADQPCSLQCASLTSLAKITPTQANEILERCSGATDLPLRISAAMAKCTMGEFENSAELLLGCLNDSDEDRIVIDSLIELGQQANPWLIDIARNRERTDCERKACFEAALAMKNVDWDRLLPLVDDPDLGVQFASFVETSDQLETQALPRLVNMLREGNLRPETQSKVRELIQADGFGAGNDEDQWANTFSINQPRALANRIEAPAAAAPVLSPESSIAVPAPATTGFQPVEPDLMPQSAQDASQPDPLVSVFYGTNREPIHRFSLGFRMSKLHVWAAVVILCVLAACFAKLPKSSLARYAVAMLFGMTVVSTMTMQWILWAGWQEISMGSQQYSGKYSSNIEYGVCQVSIPPIHQTGELESVNFLRMEVVQDVNKHVVLTNVESMDKESFIAGLNTELDRKGKNIFVFIHGYNVSFEDAARRTGQMAYDLKFPGAPVFYSWPSQANWYSYQTDRKNIEMSIDQIQSFLQDIATRSNAQTINLIAHSMGNVGLTAALQKMQTSTSPKFNQVVLAAPDVDSEVFKRDIAGKIIPQAKRTTLYTSRTDLALIASRYFNQHPRLGDSGSGLVLIDGIETIDATAVDSSLLGHSYYGSNVTVLDDLSLLLQNRSIESRSYLKMNLFQTQRFWEFEPIRLSRTPSDTIKR